MRVIIVDDERDACELLQIKMSKITQIKEIETFQSPLAALEYAGANHIDVAFLDIQMPGMRGLELAKKLKDIDPVTNIVFVTGHSEYKGDAMDLRASGYLLKPASKETIERELENLRHPVVIESKRIRVQTFGRFEVFVDGKPVLFQHEKTKELLAYLVHRRGAVMNNNEIIAAIWENRADTSSVKSQFRNLVSDLTGTLKGLGLQNIVVKKYGQTGIMADEIMCDAYDFEKGIPYAVNSYKKEYMGYTWAEFK